MKNKSKSILFALLFIFILQIIPYSYHNYAYKNLSSDNFGNGNLDTGNPMGQNASQPANLNISLDGNNEISDFQNKTGGGTYSSPYIIENLNISLISILNTSSYLIIRNCSFLGSIYNGRTGMDDITCTNCQNIRIFNCTFLYPYQYAINFENASNCYISNNTIFHSNGIYLSNSTFIDISSNIITSSDGDGINCSDCQHIQINNCTFSNSLSYSIEIQNGSNSSITNNILSNGGIYLFESNSVNISSNSETHIGVNSNYQNGISCHQCQNIQINNCNISDCLNDGIYLVDGSKSSIFKNMIIVDSANGIELKSLDLVYISFNNLSKNKVGLLLNYGEHNNIGFNIIRNNSFGICVTSSNYNQIFNNTIENNLGPGIYFLGDSDYNMIFNNTIAYNQFYGIQWGYYLRHNKMHDNNMYDNIDGNVYFYVYTVLIEIAVFIVLPAVIIGIPISVHYYRKRKKKKSAQN